MTRVRDCEAHPKGALLWSIPASTQAWQSILLWSGAVSSLQPAPGLAVKGARGKDIDRVSTGEVGRHLWRQSASTTAQARSTMRPWILDISENEDYTPFLGTLCQCLGTFSFREKIKVFSCLDEIYFVFQFVSATLFLSCH